MPVTMYGEALYNIAEACRIAGICRTTFLQWVNNGTLPLSDRKQMVAYLDVKGRSLLREHGLISMHDVERLKTEVKKSKKAPFSKQGNV